jgi:phage gp36-like protein
MSYATPDQLVARFGEVEIARLSTADGALSVQVDEARCQAAINSASALAESYLRKQVLVPIANPPQELVDCILDLARYELAHGGGREPTEQMTARQNQRMTWLRDISSGRVELAVSVPNPKGAQGAQFSDRRGKFNKDNVGLI